MKIVVENIFMCLVLFWKCYFPTNFSHFLSYFLNIQTNFITENFKITAKSQSTEQITAKSQHHTPPKLQFNPRQQTPAIKSHNHQNTTTTPPQQQQKSKSHRNQNHTQREIDGSKALGRRRDRAKARSSGVVRSARCCDRRDRCDLVHAIIGLELGVHRRRQRRDLSLLFFLSLSLSLSVWKPFEVKIGMEMNFSDQSFFFTVKWKWFLENSIFKTNPTAYFTENDFLKPFTPKTNGP